MNTLKEENAHNKPNNDCYATSSSEDLNNNENDPKFNAEFDDDGEVLPALREEYLMSYKFLIYEEENTKLRCLWCKQHDLINALSKDREYPFDKTVMQYLEIKQHKQATELQLGPKNAEKNQLLIINMLNSREKQSNEDLIQLFRIVYFLAKENLAMSKC